MGARTVALQRIFCACDACDKMIRKDWIKGKRPNKQPQFATVVNCKYRNILTDRNEWNIVTLEEDTKSGNHDDADKAKSQVLNALTTNIAEDIAIGNYGAIFTDDEREEDGFYIVNWDSKPYTDQNTGELVADCTYLKNVSGAPMWYTLVSHKTKYQIKHFVNANMEMIPIDKETNMPEGNRCNKKKML